MSKLKFFDCLAGGYNRLTQKLFHERRGSNDKGIKICILSQQHFHRRHVSEDTIEAFETAICQEKSANVIKIHISEFIFRANRKLSTIQKTDNVGFLSDLKTIYRVNKYKPDYIFIMAMGPGAIIYQEKTLKKIRSKKVVYCIDTWFSRIKEWKKALITAGVEYAFCSNKSSISIFREFVMNVHYLPYSMNERYFYPRKVQEKTHLFMQMGRKNQTLHEWILRYIRDYGLADTDYIRETERGQIIYPDFEQLAEEINKTMFFIVSPRDIDEFSITGAISDVTARFYEGMACKTLLVGFKPKDTFDTLFPSPTAMIEVADYEDFKQKIDYYRQNMDEYNQIVEFNYDFLMLHHTWRHRVGNLIEELSRQLGNSR